MNAPVNGEYFITIEDLTEWKYPENIVVYNWALPKERRMELFLKYMKEYFPYVEFDPAIQKMILVYDRQESRELINLIKKYIKTFRST